MKFAIFTYDMPHKKTSEFIIRLVINNMKPSFVIAAPVKKLKIKRSKIRAYPNHIGVIDTKRLCRYFNIEYKVMEHNSEELKNFVIENNIELGIIGGARILKKFIIDAFSKGILNLHPGLIPENRGLDTVVWAIKKWIPQGVTAHLIDEKVDLGKILNKYIIPIYSWDTIIDIGLRISEFQYHILVKEVSNIIKGNINFLNIKKLFPKNVPGDDSVDKFVLNNFERYKEYWAVDRNGYRCICGEKLNIDDLTCPKCGRGYTLENFDVLKLVG